MNINKTKNTFKKHTEKHYETLSKILQVPNWKVQYLEAIPPRLDNTPLCKALNDTKYIRDVDDRIEALIEYVPEYFI